MSELEVIEPASMNTERKPPTPPFALAIGIWLIGIAGCITALCILMFVATAAACEIKDNIIKLFR